MITVASKFLHSYSYSHAEKDVTINLELVTSPDNFLWEQLRQDKSTTTLKIEGLFQTHLG